MMKEEMQLPTPASTVMEDFATSSPREPTNHTKSATFDETADKQDKSESTESGSSAQSDLTLQYGSPAFQDVPSKDRKAHRFCGCMCDMRRAVIAVNGISIFFALIEIVISAVLLGLYDDGDTIEINSDGSFKWLSLNQELSKAFLFASLGLAVVAVLFYALGIRGAKRFNKCLVGAALFYHCVSAVLNLIGLNIIGVLFSLLFIYPHVFLIIQMSKGIMTKENYANERRTCCA